MITRETPAFSEKMDHVDLEGPNNAKPLPINLIQNKPSDLSEVNNRSRNSQIEKKPAKIRNVDI